MEDLRRPGVARLRRRLALGRLEMLPQQREDPVLRNLKLDGRLLIDEPHIGPQPRIGGQPLHGLRHHGVREGIPGQLDQLRPHLLTQLFLHTRCARGKGKAGGKLDPADLLIPEHSLVCRCRADEPSLDGPLFQPFDLAQGRGERLPPLSDRAVGIEELLLAEEGADGLEGGFGHPGVLGQVGEGGAFGDAPQAVLSDDIEGRLDSRRDLQGEALGLPGPANRGNALKDPCTGAKQTSTLVERVEVDGWKGRRALHPDPQHLTHTGDLGAGVNRLPCQVVQLDQAACPLPPHPDALRLYLLHLDLDFVTIMEFPQHLSCMELVDGRRAEEVLSRLLGAGPHDDSLDRLAFGEKGMGVLDVARGEVTSENDSPMPLRCGDFDEGPVDVLDAAVNALKRWKRAPGRLGASVLPNRVVCGGGTGPRGVVHLPEEEIREKACQLVPQAHGAESTANWPEKVSKKSKPDLDQSRPLTAAVPPRAACAAPPRPPSSRRRHAR